MPDERQLRAATLAVSAADFDLELDLFITAKEAERCTPRTIKTYRWTLRKFIAWLQAQGPERAQGVSPHHIRKFLTHLDKQGYTSSYIHIYARTIKTWLRFLYAEELLPTNPMAKVAMPHLDNEILPAFTADDVKNML